VSSSPRVISLDIETYGAAATNGRGTMLPAQTVFHPARAIATDGVARQDLVLTCAITVAAAEPPPANVPGSWNLDGVAALVPGPTFTLNLTDPTTHATLIAWLRHAHTIVGMNLPFDILWLRAFSPAIALALNGRHTLIDLSVVNFLHSELRPERSLKSLGPVLGTHAYNDAATLKDGRRFASPTSPELHAYNAQDTHNTLLAVAHLARRIKQDYPQTHKLGEYSVHHFSETLWSTIRMSEAGIPFSLPRLMSLERELLDQAETASNCAAAGGVLIEGEGSVQSQREFMARCIEDILPTNPDFLSHPLLTYTEKAKELSWSSENRRLIASHLPDSHPARTIFECADKHSTAQKLVSSYTYPLLRHRRTKPTDRSSVLLSRPDSPTIGIAYPTWYTVPSIPKDSGSEGGTIQARITCKNPAAQTFPAVIKDCEASRYPGGSIVSFDLSQIELRVAAILSGEPTLLAAFNDGVDLHTQRTLAIFGQDSKDRPDFKALRQIGKTVNFADLFGASSARLQRSVLDMSGTLYPLTFFDQIVASRYEQRPGLVQWQHSLCREAEAKGYIELPYTGHTRTFTSFRLDQRAWNTRRELKQVLARGGKSMISEVCNFPVQATAGNVMLAIQNFIHRALGPITSPTSHKQPQLFLQVYDALYFDCPPGTEKQAADLMWAAVEFVGTAGYWHQLCKRSGHHAPLIYE
jgi:DNA polymerase I-like protein with 3'-5' exonuclease and polymerase domains